MRCLGLNLIGVFIFCALNIETISSEFSWAINHGIRSFIDHTENGCSFNILHGGSSFVLIYHWPSLFRIVGYRLKRSQSKVSAGKSENESKISSKENYFSYILSFLTYNFALILFLYLVFLLFFFCWFLSLSFFLLFSFFRSSCL